MSLDLTPWDSFSAFVDSNGVLTTRSQFWLQSVLQQLNDEFGALAAAQAAQAAAEAADAAAAAAQTAADNADAAAGGALAAAGTAQSAADQAAADASLASSGTIGATLTASDAGSSVTITVSAHTRAYGNGDTVSVDGGTVTGLSYGTVYYVYYLDPARAGGAVTYQASTDPSDAVQIGTVHSAGSAATPLAAAPDQDGRAWNAPGLPY